jgi:hypothetical protein
MWDNWPEMQGETPLSRDDFATRFAYDTGYKHSMQGALQQRVLIKMAVGTWKIENFSEFP